MKRRTFLMQSGAGLAAAALPGLTQAPKVSQSADAHHQEANAPSMPTAVHRSIVHPGILQTRSDLEFMKSKIKAGEDPWKSAWDRLLAEPNSSLDFKPNPVIHIVRGAYGAGEKGGAELSASAAAVNSHVLQWVVTGNHANARKAIEIFDAWSSTLADFFENDAMLLAGWTGGEFCNAAEILRATYPGWRSESINQFKRMLCTVYVPLLRMYYPEANGNWDAAIMYTMLSIGIFCENRQMMEEAYRHYRVGPVNSGITRYIYPSGQCEESTRDMGHTQLGLGYLARTAMVAWNQGVDLFSEADNRLALGYEYTSKYMLGEDVPVYGVISEKARGHFSDIYSIVLQHYRHEKHISMPYTEQATAKALPHSRSVITAFRGDRGAAPAKLLPSPAPSQFAVTAGAQAKPSIAASQDSIQVAVGQSIQDALDKLKASGGGTLSLGSGLHTLPATLRVPSGVTIAGTGLDCELFLDPEAKGSEAAMVNAEPDMHDVVLRDLVIEGAQTSKASTDPNSDVQTRRPQHSPIRAGLVFLADDNAVIRNLKFDHITVRNCTYSAVEIYGAEQIDIFNCDFSSSGGMTPPGLGKNHNLKLNHVAGVTITGTRLADSMWGNGVAVSFGRGILIRNCEIARNALDGARLAESKQVTVEACLAEGNGGAGIAQQTWMEPNEGVVLRHNTLRNNVVSG